MGPYAYAITIKRDTQTVCEDITHELEDSSLSLDILRPLVGDNLFTVEDGDYGGYTITVHTKRLETDAEYATRIKREEKYMVEYRKRENKNIWMKKSK